MKKRLVSKGVFYIIQLISCLIIGGLLFTITAILIDVLWFRYAALALGVLIGIAIPEFIFDIDFGKYYNDNNDETDNSRNK